MNGIRKKKRFPSDLKSNLVQRDLSNFSRIGTIIEVFPERGVCSIRWLDKPGIRHNVQITQASPKTFEIPEKGSVVLVVFDHHERSRIIRYINLGHEDRVRHIKSLPRFKEGEKFFEVGGSYMYMRRNGDIILATANQGYFIIDNSTGTFKSESVNWRVTTEAGIMYSGLIKRFVDGGDGSRSNEIITNFEGKDLTEFRIRLVETADGALGLSGIEDPLVDIAIGTYVDDEGVIVNKKDTDTTANTTKALTVRITLKSGVKIFIDKEGRLSIEGAIININKAKVDTDDADVALGLETASVSGDRGQHAAREHDAVVVPISNNFEDADHTELITASQLNIIALQVFASAIMSPSGPCSLNPALLSDITLQLKGIITEGSENFLIGDE